MATATQLGPIESPNLLSGTTDTTYQLHLADPVGNLAMLEATANTGYALQNFLTPTQHWALGVGGSVTTTAPNGAFYLFDNTDAMGPLLSILPGSGDVDFVGSVRSYGPHQTVDTTASNVMVGTGSGSGIPAIALVSAVGALDEKIWFIDAGHYTFQIRTTMDDESADNIWFAAVRSGLVIESVTITTNLLAISGNVTASDAQFATCEVANSPVRTFANTADGEGPDYPPAGIGVSTGTAWDADSIDPSTLATWPGVGIPVSTGSAWGASINPASLAGFPAAGIPVSTGAAWGASINPATLATFPAAGVAVSTGSAWAAPINPANIPLLDGSGNLTITGMFLSGSTVKGSALLFSAQGAAAPGQGMVDVLSGTQGRLMYRASGTGSTAPSFVIAGMSGDGSVYDLFATFGPTGINLGYDLIVQTNAIGAIPIPSNGCRMTWNLGAGVGETDFINGYPVGSGATGGFRWYSGVTGNSLTSSSPYLMYLDGAGNLSVPGNLNLSGFTNGLRIGGATVVPGYVANQTMMAMPVAGNLYVDVTGTSTSNYGVLHFRSMISNGSVYQEVLTVANTGVSVTGTFTATTKNFRIVHPLDDEMWLVHGSLEGPENGVYYRGEGATVDSWAEVELPDYFEALTMQENRTVYLTPFFEDDTELCSTVAASRVKDGKFKVWSALPAQKFYWMVMAVRGDVPELVVEQEPIPEPIFDAPTQPIAPTPNEESNDEQAGTDKQPVRATKRSGTVEDGKLHTAPRPNAAAASKRADRPGRARKADRR
jgi:hypothetical protein